VKKWLDITGIDGFHEILGGIRKEESSERAKGLCALLYLRINVPTLGSYG
jgi:hypothetical protein